MLNEFFSIEDSKRFYLQADPAHLPKLLETYESLEFVDKG